MVEGMKITPINSKAGVASIRVAMKRILRGQGGRAAFEFASKASDYRQHLRECIICGDNLLKPISQGPPTTNPYQEFCDECRIVIGDAVMHPDFDREPTRSEFMLKSKGILIDDLNGGELWKCTVCDFTVRETDKHPDFCLYECDEEDNEAGFFGTVGLCPCCSSGRMQILDSDEISIAKINSNEGY